MENGKASRLSENFKHRNHHHKNSGFIWFHFLSICVAVLHDIAAKFNEKKINVKNTV